MERVLRQQLKVGFLSAVNFIIYIGTQKSIGRITNNISQIFPNIHVHFQLFNIFFLLKNISAIIHKFTVFFICQINAILIIFSLYLFRHFVQLV